jgi:hypothetical protein
MRALSHLHDDLLNILSSYSDWFFSSDYLNRLTPTVQYPPKSDPVEDPTSAAYLKEALTDDIKSYGFPRQLFGQTLEDRHDVPRAPIDYIKKTKAMTNELQMFLGARTAALAMYYPPGGYIGWHHNGNAPGYNLILTINPQADGEFEYLDPSTDQTIKFEDKPTWYGKVGYFGDVFKKEELCWHTARTRTPRLTVSFVIYNKHIWEQMIEDIER